MIMKLPEWNLLPENMRTEAVKQYYDIINNKKVSLLLKRTFDVCGSAGLLAALSPVFAGVAAWIKHDSPGPVIYTQERVTSMGKRFNIKKFRTMVTRADKIGSLVTVDKDPRITKSGEFLRKYRLDEIPQLINVLRGEMSFVGTRPEVPKYVDAYTPEMLATLLLPAGITSRASIMYKDEDKLLKNVEDADKTYINDILPEKMKYNLESLKSFSFLQDIETMIKTVFAVSGIEKKAETPASAAECTEKNKKNILYIDHYAGSLSYGMEYRPYYLAREWIKNGYNVKILGADYSHLRIKNPEVKKDLETSEVDGVPFRWLKTMPYSGNGAKRAITMFMFAGKLCVYAAKLAREEKPDVVIASSTYPLDTYGAKLIAKLSGGKCVHEIHDMWPITPIELYGMSPKHPFVIAMQLGENFFCRHADKIVSVLPCAKEYLTEHGMAAEKFEYIPNGINLSDWDNPEELPVQHRAVLEKAHDEGRFVLCFFGSHTKSYSLDYLLNAYSKIDRSKTLLLFVGDGIYKEELQSLAAKLGFTDDTCVFLPPIPKRAVPTLLKQCDASYIGAIRNRMFRFGIGMNKLFDAMMSGKPLLYAVDAPNNFAVEYNCGISVEAENEDALAAGITQLLAMSEDERKAMGDNGKNAVLNNFTYPVLAKRFSDKI